MKNRSIQFRNLLLTVFALSLFSCSTTKLANPGEAQRLQNMAPPDGKALIYFIRPSAVGSVVNMKITCDGRHIGSTTGKRYIYALVEPGKREFVSHAENKDELPLVTEAGQTYFIEQKAKMGIVMARTRLERISEEEGRQKLAKCKLSGDCPAYVAQGNE